MLFRSRRSIETKVDSTTDAASILSRFVACALPTNLQRRSPRTKSALNFQSLEPRLVMCASLELDGQDQEENLAHGSHCGCGCCCGGADLHGFPAVESGDVPDDGGGGETSPLASLPLLSSNPDAEVKLYLDFDGHFEADWGSFDDISSPAFSLDGDYNTFNTAEMNAITEIWQRVSEDYAPFNIDVTTIEPDNFDNGSALRIVIGGSSSWYGNTVGGVAYINSFTNSVVNTAYVFPNHLAKNARYIAEATSHEAGHAFGLRHQSKYVDGNKTDEYHPGSGDWAPIMGLSYYKTRSTWHDGTTYSDSAYQDDMALIARSQNGFGYRDDDHGGFNSATALNFVDRVAANSGIVGLMDDKDAFSFTTSAGTVELDLNVAEVGANLDSVLELWTAEGTLIATADPSNDYGATISMSLDAGDYVLIVRSTGEYGSVGQYTISATLPAETIAIDISGDSTAAQGHEYTLNLDQTAIGEDPIQSWTIDWGDGNVEVINGNPDSATHTYNGDPGQYTILASVTDGSDTYEADALVVEVFDPQPVLQVTGANSTQEGSTYQLSLSSSGAGAQSITKWTINWGDGTIQVVNGDPNSVNHVYADGDANYTIQASVTNAFGTFAAANFNISVQDVDADVEISGQGSIDGGSEYELNLSSTDPGDDTITQWTINWGDGTIEVVNGNPSSVTHTYANETAQYNITASATDEDGTYQANSIQVATTKIFMPALNFNDLTIDSYGGRQDKDGTATILDGGSTLKLSGNTWKSVEFNYTVTADTILEFDFYSPVQGEVHAIGFDNNSDHYSGQNFQLYGSDAWGWQEFRTYDPESGVVHFKIPVGEFFSGAMDRITFVNDHDNGPENGQGLFSNLRVYERLTAQNEEMTVDEWGVNVSLDVLDNDTPTTGINPENLQISSVGVGSDGGVMVISNDGHRLKYTPADGFVGEETFSYTIIDGSGNEATAVVTVVVQPAVSIEGPEVVEDEETVQLLLNSRDGANVTGWTIDWGDGNVQVLNTDPSSVSHTYELAGMAYNIVATAHYSGGSYHAQEWEVEVRANTIDLNSVDVTSYAGKQDAGGTSTVEDFGSSLRLKGNTWKSIYLPYTVTKHTVLEFDFASLKKAEIQGIGFDNDLNHNNSRTFQLAGMETWGRQDFRTYSGNGEPEHFVIPIGEFFTGQNYYLFFVNDHDSGNPNGEAIFSNVRIYETISAQNDSFEINENDGPIKLNVLLNDSPTTDVDSSELEIISVTQGSQGGVLTITNGGTRVRYTPPAGFIGVETFTYVVTDGLPNSQTTATVQMTVNPVTSIGGETEVGANGNFTLELDSLSGTTITKWTIDWGDGNVEVVNSNPETVNHTYAVTGRRYVVTATAANAGQDYASRTLNVDVDLEDIDFSDKPIRSYAGTQDKYGFGVVQDGGASVRLVGNSWKRISYPMTITENTVLSFDVNILKLGEVHGIGFDNDWFHSASRTFQLGGTQVFGLQDFRTYSNGDGTVRFDIPVGQYYTGYVKYLFFVNDDDVKYSRSTSIFSNIRVFEQGPPGEEAPAAASLTTVTSTDTPFSEAETSPFTFVSEAQSDFDGKTNAAIFYQEGGVNTSVKVSTQPDAPTQDAAPPSGMESQFYLSDQEFYELLRGPSTGVADELIAELAIEGKLSLRDAFFALYDGTLDLSR